MFFRVLIIAVYALGLLLGPAVDLGLAAEEAVEEKQSNLVACPDCEEQVSKRAVMCPNCGCPGEVIATYVAELEEAKKPKSVVQVEAPAGGGIGIAMKSGNHNYIVTTLAACGSAESLSLKTRQGESLAYYGVEVAKDMPLVRFAVKGESVVYLPVSDSGDSTQFLDATGKKADVADNAAAKLDPQGRVAAIHSGQTSYLVSESTKWHSIQPAKFRSQMSRLADLKGSSREDPNISWHTPSMARYAETLSGNKN